MRLRYTDWDGTQDVRLDADRVFGKLAEYLSYTDDVEQALDWLLRQGAEFDGFEVVGLDELLERVRQEIRDKFSQVNIDRALDEPRRRLDELLDLERDASGAARSAELDAYSAERALAEVLRRLADFDFVDDDARHEFETLAERLDDIEAVTDFQRRYGDRFQGPRALDFDETLELMREMERLERLQEQLLRGDLDGVDVDTLRAALGEQAARQFGDLRQMMLLVRQSGTLQAKEGRTTLSAKGVRKLGRLALRDIYQGLLRDRSGAHATDHRGPTELRPDERKTYAYGDPLHLDIVATLKKSLARGGVPLAVEPGDFEVYATDLATSTATVLLLDMSWSMSWEGRFAAAKKVAMAMETLIRTKYPRDFFAVVGFYTRAVELGPRDLPEASWNMGDPFTNLQDGLRKGAALLDRQRTRNKHLIVITDGQPTAYFSGGRLYCEWPLSFGGVSKRAAQETLREVERVTRKGITINTFMLDDSPALRAFVERMTRINRGRALYARPDRLGEYLLVDYLGKKRKRG